MSKIPTLIRSVTDRKVRFADASQSSTGARSRGLRGASRGWGLGRRQQQQQVVVVADSEDELTAGEDALGKLKGSESFTDVSAFMEESDSPDFVTMEDNDDFEDLYDSTDFTGAEDEDDSFCDTTNSTTEEDERFPVLSPPLMTRVPARTNTMFTTQGSPSAGTRSRIRTRQPVKMMPEADVTSVKIGLNAPDLDNFISKEKLVQIRTEAWQPTLVFEEGQEVSLAQDFLTSYLHAFECGKRGCTAWQKVRRKGLAAIFRPGDAFRFLTMDATDPVSFVTTYRISSHTKVPVKLLIFTVDDFLHAKWYPVGGKIELEYYELKDDTDDSGSFASQRKGTKGWRICRETFKGVPWNFFECLIVACREISVWRRIAREMDTFKALMQARNEALEAETRRHNNEEHKRVASINETEGGSKIGALHDGTLQDETPNIGTSRPGRGRSRFQIAPDLKSIIPAIRLGRARLDEGHKSEETLTSASSMRDLSPNEIMQRQHSHPTDACIDMTTQQI